MITSPIVSFYILLLLTAPLFCLPEMFQSVGRRNTEEGPLNPSWGRQEAGGDMPQTLKDPEVLLFSSCHEDS